MITPTYWSPWERNGQFESQVREMYGKELIVTRCIGFVPQGAVLARVRVVHNDKQYELEDQFDAPNGATRQAIVRQYQGDLISEEKTFSSYITAEQYVMEKF